MRPLLLISLFLLVAAPALADAPTPPRSAAILLHVRPGVWRPPVAVAARPAAMRFDPETGEAVAPLTAPSAALMTREQAEANVRMDADGSLHSVLGGAVRRYLVVHVRPDGTLEEECLPSASEAIRRVNAAASAPPVPAKKEGR